MRRLLTYNILALILLALCPLTTNAQEVVKGDVNADEKINAADIVELNAYLMGKPSLRFHDLQADVNSDGSIDEADLKALSQLMMKAEGKVATPNSLCISADANQWTNETSFTDVVSKDGAISAFVNEKGETVFLLYDFINYTTYIICPTRQGFCMATHDPTTDTMDDHIVYYQETEDQYAVGSYEVDWDKLSIRPDSCCVAIRLQHAAPLRQPALRRDPTMQGIYNQFADMFDYMSDGNSNLSTMYEVTEKGLGYDKPGMKPSLATDYISKLFHGAANAFRGYSLGVTGSELAIDYGTEAVVDAIVKKDKRLETISTLLGIVVNRIDIDMTWSDFTDTFKKNIHNTFGFAVPEEEAKQVVEYVWRKKDIIESVPEPDIIHEQAYRVEVKVTDIKATSAVISGSYKEVYPEGSIINMGYVIEGPDGKQDVSAFGLPPTTIKLEPGTKYTVYAYLSSTSAPGGRYMSQPVTFVTEKEEKFDLFMDVIVFGCEGGSQPIDVYAPEGVTWSIQDVPSWVKVTTADDSFTVTVGETEEEREDYFTIVVTYSDGTTEYIPFRVTQEGEEEEVTLDTDIIFEGELEYSSDHNHWVNGEAHPNIEQDKMPFLMGLTMDDEGHAYLSIAADGGVFTMELSDPVTTLTMITGERLNGERNKDGWRYVLSSHNYEAKDDEIRLDWTIDGDWVVDEKGNTASDVSYSIKGNGYSKNVGYIAITGLTTDSPVLDWFDATESEVEYTYTYDYLDQKTHYKSHDKDYTMGKLQGHWNDEEE